EQLPLRLFHSGRASPGGLWPRNLARARRGVRVALIPWYIETMSAPPEDDAVLDASALEQARLVRDRRISSEELTRAYLARIERLNPTLNAFVQVTAAAALRAAREKDEALLRGDEVPPFHGVPTAIKDLNLVRGAFTRFGSRAMKYFWSPFDD